MFVLFLGEMSQMHYYLCVGPVSGVAVTHWVDLGFGQNKN